MARGGEPGPIGREGDPGDIKATLRKAPPLFPCSNFPQGDALVSGIVAKSTVDGGNHPTVWGKLGAEHRARVPFEHTKLLVPREKAKLIARGDVPQTESVVCTNGN